MASILVVDDRPINREFLVTLLGYFKHELLQAADGAEALALARAHHPDLVITDVLMPVMDGVEFVRRLHADPASAGIPVIFYTATYRLGDAWDLARSCGVDSVIGKPAAPQTILAAVAAKLGGPAPVPPGPGAATSGLRRLQQQLTDVPGDAQAQRSPEALIALSLRLAALLEVGQDLASERDPDRLLDSFIRAASDIMNTPYAAVGVFARGGRVATCGLPVGLWPVLAAESGEPVGGVLGRLLAEGGVQRVHGEANCAGELPAGHPAVCGLLALPIRSPTRSYGWLYFAGKLGGAPFLDEDEQIANILSDRLALACENLQLFDDAQRYAGELEIEAAARRESEARFRELAENIREVFWLIDPTASKIFYVSPAYEEIWGRSCASLYAAPGSWRAAIHPADRAAVRQGLSRMRESGRFDLQFRLQRPDRSECWVRSRGFPIRDERGELLRIAGLVEDVTESMQQQRRIARLNRVLAVLSGINSAIVRLRERPLLFDEACRIAVDDGQFALAWIGRAEAAPDGRQLTPLAWRARDNPAWPAPLPLRFVADEGEGKTALLGSGHVTVCAEPPGATWRSRAMLSLREEGVVIGAMVLYAEEAGFFDADEIRVLNELAGDLSFALDYLAREERLNYLAYYDALTGLPNRSLFFDRVMQLLHAAPRDGSTVALILLDIEHFKQINDRFGRHVGDALLKQLADRLSAVLREPSSVARVGANLYAIAVGALPANDGALSVLHERVFATLASAFPCADGELRLSARAGLALFPGDGDSAELLFAHAEVALAQAKRSGKRYFYFDDALNARIVAKQALESDLRDALKAGQFVVYYQPKINLQNGRIVGAEALIRWLHPQRGLIGPVDFIPLAEECGLIAPIGEWVLRSVCAQQARWLGTRLDIVPVAVNLSVAQLRAGNVVAIVRDALAAAQLDARCLELELTESVVMDDPEAQIGTLKALRQMGVGLALDDFGTGYSSLAYLKRYPFSSIKIDRTFITELTRSPDDAAIVDAAIGLARRLGMKTVAEGVETQAQMHYLRRLGCDEMQGYLFSRPVPLADYQAMLRGGERLALPLAAQSAMRTLLLVDDEPHILSALQRLLRGEGYRVLTAGSGGQGLELLAVSEAQVIISDQRMAGMSGAEFLSVVKELYPDTIRIILSGYTDLAAVTDAVNRGAVFKFLTKPWDDELLRENIRDAFRRHRSAESQQRPGGLAG